jgi:RNA polymerase sigma factor (TIGR02999 family)
MPLQQQAIRADANGVTHAAIAMNVPSGSALDSAPPGGWGWPMGEITQLLDRARGGDGAAWEDVVELLYADLKRLARGAIGGSAHTLGATGLVHECYERLARSGALGVRDRCHFLSLSARIMRQILINHARDRVAAKRGGGLAPVHGVEAQAAENLDEEAQDLLHLDLALRQLEAIDARLVHVVECRIFAGLSEDETAQALQVPLRTAQRLWLRARDQLRELLQAPA